MKHSLLFVGLFLGAGVVRLGAQAPASAATSPTNAATARRPSGPPPVRSPEFGADRVVTFRLRAPKATEVVLAGQWPNGRTNLTKGTNDVWSVTVGPIDPGVWEYSFQVDGLAMIDPGNSAIKPQREPHTSILQLPAQPPLLTEFQDVPHGVVHQHTAPTQEAVASALNDPAGTNQRLKLLWISVGQDDILRQRNEEFIAALKEKDVHHEWHLTEGNHSWTVWRLYLAEFLPKLFR